MVDGKGSSTKNQRGGGGIIRTLLFIGLVSSSTLMLSSLFTTSSSLSDLFAQQQKTIQQHVESIVPNNVSSTSQSDWPGIPVERLGSHLVKKGTNFVAKSRELLLENLDEFLQVYKNRPDTVNMCGIRINHAYALFIAIKYLNPSAIIESGVNAGQSTYFMRAAAPHAMIFPIDPLDKPICDQKTRWMDTKNSSVYYTGKNFQDIGSIDWKKHADAGQLDPDRTLIFLDDHLEVFDRLPPLMKHGFRHVVLEDNYKVGKGATPGDKAGWTPKQMFSRIDADSEFLWHIIKSYAEFPPLVAPILAKNSNEPNKPAGGFLHYTNTNEDIVEPILRAERDDGDKAIYEKICKVLDIDPELRDKNSYMQIMNYNQFSYFELVPMAPRLRREVWSLSSS